MVKLVGLVVLHLIASSGGTVTANNLREKLRIKAVSMVGHMAGEADGRKSGVPSVLRGVPGIRAIRSDMPAGGFSHAVGVFVGATGECGFT